ncbi:hypothetical protein DY000_02004858 [Brassica cretica]|uniref:F-box domain-containing protein n=1 Tax=Brassica cretica TaxID=69181 RepID=A0ABQ7CG24_BRACR|nr:hypothetical protein DY000_02004858 [Brassica cretica]
MQLTSLPSDLIENILSKVPDTPLARFRTTSKQWNGSISMNHLLRLQLIHSTLKIHFPILHKSIYVTFSTATSYCYVAQRTIDSWFGILIQVKPRISFLADEQNKVVMYLNTGNNLHILRENKHILEEHLGGGSTSISSPAVLMNYPPSLARIRQGTFLRGRKRKAESM